MTSSMFIVAAKRTPFGAFGGSLASQSATQLAVTAATAALGSRASAVDATTVGNVVTSSADAAYIGRHVALQSGVAVDKPALTLNRLCGSGLETVRWATQEIQTTGTAVTAVLAAGAENMSAAPLQASGVACRNGIALGKGLELRDSLWDALTDSHAGTPMGITAENLASDYNITREQCDQYALRSQQKWLAAHQAGLFEAELAPVTVMQKKKEVLISVDEHPRPGSTLEKLSKLPSVFAKNGTVTAANASGICDGAGALLVASQEAVTANGWQPLARIVASSVVGCDPTRMGIGPVPAIQQVLLQADKTLQDLQRIEINEAFAAQVLACASALDISVFDDDSILNINGGAIALGHPLAASGSRILAHLAHAPGQPGDLTVGAACIGGGQGIAVLLEKV